MTDEGDLGLLTRLRNLIGRECVFLGKPCRLMEILSDQGVLILEVREQLPPIQRDQYGQASFRANDTIQVPIFGPDRSSFSEEMIDLFNSLKAAGGNTPDRM